jgi:hypothetical protein
MRDAFRGEDEREREREREKRKRRERLYLPHTTYGMWALPTSA